MQKNEYMQVCDHRPSSLGIEPMTYEHKTTICVVCTHRDQSAKQHILVWLSSARHTSASSGEERVASKESLSAHNCRGSQECVPAFSKLQQGQYSKWTYFNKQFYNYGLTCPYIDSMWHALWYFFIFFIGGR